MSKQITSPEDLRQFLAQNSVRPPVPGEVWKFDALEAHAVYMGLDALKPFMDEEDAESLLVSVFENRNAEYNLKDVRGEMPSGISVTPTPEDVGFFNAFIASMRWHLWCLPTEVEVEKDGVPEKVPFELPCGHTPTQHETLLRGWYDREIIGAKAFAATRRALASLPAEERITGLPVIARSDLERQVSERVENELAGGLYAPEPTEELVQDIVTTTGQSREEAEEIVRRMRSSAERKMQEELLALSEKNYRVIEDF